MSDTNDINEVEPSEAELLEFTKPAKQDSRGRAWMLTLPVAEYDEAAVRAGLERYTGFIGQMEEGSKKDEDGQGYRHWQLYVENDNPIRFTALRSQFPKGHFEMRRATAAICVAYVTKVDTRIGEVIEHGTIKVENQQGRRTDLEEMYSRIKEGERYEDLIMSDVRALRNFATLKTFQAQMDAEDWGSRSRPHIEAHYLWGGTGVGKTSAIYAKHGMHYRTVHSIDNYTSRANHWDSYSAQPVLLLDEFESSYSTQFMRKLLQPFPLQLPARYSNRFAAWERVYVVSNEPYSAQWREEDPSSTARAAVHRRFTSIGKMNPDGSVTYQRRNWIDLAVPETVPFEEAFGVEMPEYLEERIAATVAEGA